MMKRILLNIMLACLPVVGASAYDFEVDGIYYNINDDRTSVSVTYAFSTWPYEYDSYDYYSGDLIIPSTVIYNNFRYNVAIIGDETEGTTIGVIKANATPVLIKSRDGLLSVEELPDGTRVGIYTTAGTLVCTTVCSNGLATVDTGLPSGTIAIIKTDKKNVKVTIK